MSSGLRGGAKLRGLLWLIASNRILRDIVLQARAYSAHHDLEAAFRSHLTQTKAQVSFHPAAPDIVFSIEGGQVVMSATTSAVGPGYHAFVVGFTDHLSTHNQWTWNFKSATQGFYDDTGFFQDRNFSALQAHMKDAFTTLCQTLLDTTTGTNGPYYISLQLPLTIAGDYFAATSLGLRDRDFFEKDVPDQFFPWWEEGVSEETLKNLALCKMWLEISWCRPDTAIEKQDLENCQYVIDRALERGARFTDYEAIEDVAALRRGEHRFTGTEARRVGYWRQDVQCLGLGGWSVILPGYYRENLSEDGLDYVLAHEDRAVYLSSETFEVEQTELDWPQETDEDFKEDSRFKTDLYWAILQSPPMMHDQASLYAWRGLYRTLWGTATVTAVSRHADDSAWADTILRTVKPDIDTQAVITSLEI